MLPNDLAKINLTVYIIVACIPQLNQLSGALLQYMGPICTWYQYMGPICTWYRTDTRLAQYNNRQNVQDSRIY